jgi:hypothetical protein
MTQHRRAAHIYTLLRVSGYGTTKLTAATAPVQPPRDGIPPSAGQRQPATSCPELFSPRTVADRGGVGNPPRIANGPVGRGTLAEKT